MTERDLLNQLDTMSLEGTHLEVSTDSGENRIYILKHKCGAGKTGIAWRASDSVGRSWAVKFVMQADYASHTIDAEAQRVSQLSTDRIARISFYGEPRFEDQTIPSDKLYAIVVDWVEGPTLREYLNQRAGSVDVPTFLMLARSLCEVVHDLRKNRLSHNDLHDANIIVSSTCDPLDDSKVTTLRVIDTGSLKSEARRLALIEMWRECVKTLRTDASADDPKTTDAIAKYENWIRWFDRTDQEWLVFHLCSLFNCLVRPSGRLDPPSAAFVAALPHLLDLMADSDRSRRIDDAREMYRRLSTTWKKITQPDEPQMSDPFDLISAELIRSDKQLMALFSKEFPRLSACRSGNPIYLYGPRGCGKSTLLRSLSLKAILRSPAAVEELRSLPFIGVYLSCSSELRSRFWLMPDDDYAVLEGHVVRYFNLLLLEELVDTLERMRLIDGRESSVESFAISDDDVGQICHDVRTRAGLSAAIHRYSGVSSFVALKASIRNDRDELWKRILDREEPRMRPDAQMLFDICKQLADILPVFAKRPIAFLLDDYSNQRIPRALQRHLNQAISFAKQGNPIFKVVSEYEGVDLTGIQEGREVVEVNVGLEYVGLKDKERWLFLRDMLQKRFQYLGHPVDLLTVLPLSECPPCIPLARKLCDCHTSQDRKFYYHGLDTISDVCSGDFAMALDLVRRIFEAAKVDWRAPREIEAKVQDRTIARFGNQEMEYIRYLAPSGGKKYAIMSQLCWFARECMLRYKTPKDGKHVPMVKIHLDIADAALVKLRDQFEENANLLDDLVRHGVLFPLDDSRSREQGRMTRRFQIRRILLARARCALGRHTPIRIDTMDKLNHLLTDPESFVQGELKASADDPNQSRLELGDHDDEEY